MKTKIIILISIFLGLILAMMITFTILAMLSPIRMVDEINRNYPDTSQAKPTTDELLRLEKEVAFLNARLSMAQSDSTSLAINLIDSVIIMEIQGVKLLETRILKISSSKVFNKYNRDAFFANFSTPFFIENDYSTIPKIAFHIKYAPEDTIAAQSPKTIPDSTVNNPVYYNLYLNKNLMIEIRQTDTLKTGIFRNYDKHLKREKLNRIWRNVIRFKVPPYEPWIRIEIPGNDARAIYKALPRHAQVAVII